MAFVVSDGRLRAIERVPSPLSPSYSLQLGENLTADYATLWRTQPELRTVVDFLARNIAQLGIHVFRRVSDVDRKRLIDHPLARLLSSPNAGTTRYRLVDALIHDVCIFDNAFWMKTKAEQGTPIALRRVPPQRVSPTGTNWQEPEGYLISGSRGQLQVTRNEIVHFHGYNPLDDRVGASPIESLRRILAEEWAANVYREQLWRNGARMAGYLSRPADAPDWSDSGRNRFRDQWQAQYAGDGPHAGGTPILEDGMTFVSASTSPRDAQYVESRKLTREEVARSYHVPLPMVGILDHATFSNIREQHKQLYQDCLGPWLEMIQQEIELQIVPDLPDRNGVYVEFNISAKLSGSFEDQAAQLQAGTGAPYMTRNEARARLNLPQVDGGDELIVPLNVTVGAQAPVPAEPAPKQEPRARVKARAPQTVTDAAATILSRFFARQGQIVLSGLGAQKTKGRKASPTDVFDVERWNGELAGDLLRVNSQISLAAASATLEQAGLDPGQFAPEPTLGWLAANAAAIALAVNTVTLDQLGTALADDDPTAATKTLFEGYVAVRAAQLATTQTTAISGFGSCEAIKQTGADDGATKTWQAGVNARPTHAALNGQTVGLHDHFSNGARWPADINLSADETAGCNCALQIAIA
jgi:HK97 family phage portal protein